MGWVVQRAGSWPNNALQLTAYSFRFAALRSGFRQQLKAGVGRQDRIAHHLSRSTVVYSSCSRAFQRASNAQRERREAMTLTSLRIMCAVGALLVGTAFAQSTATSPQPSGIRGQNALPSELQGICPAGWKAQKVSGERIVCTPDPSRIRCPAGWTLAQDTNDPCNWACQRPPR